jgi:oxygen-dependent protoporphyrinogen oxidase
MRGTGFVVPRVEGLAVLATTFVTSKWPGRAPVGHVLLRAFFGGGRDPARLDAHDDAMLTRLAQEELGPLLGIQGEPELTRVARWVRQSPQYTVGHAGRVRQIETHLGRLPGVFAVGSGFGAIGIPDCVSHGRRAAAATTAFLRSLGARYHA